MLAPDDLKIFDVSSRKLEAYCAWKMVFPSAIEQCVFHSYLFRELSN